VLPAGPAYAGLLAALGDRVDAAVKKLEVYAGREPPPPPDGPPPPWMATRPAGIRAFCRLRARPARSLSVLRAFDRPAYFALGGRSNPDYYARMAKRHESVFPDVTVEVFPVRHRLDPPHRVEPKRLAASLLALWKRAEGAASG
jgi:hypothetical protein